MRRRTTGHHNAAVETFDEVAARAEADPLVCGVVLTGSHARGLATERSDHDVYVVLTPPAGAAPAWAPRRGPELDLVVCTVGDLADTSDTYARYTFRGARVLLDRLGAGAGDTGGIAALVRRQAVPTEAEAAAWARGGLDGFLNLTYRAAKNRRDGDPVAARLDEMESVSYLLTAIFALHGRLRPFHRYLRWELAEHPLGPAWADLPGRAAADPAGLLPQVVGLARERGHGDVVDAWGDDLSVMTR